MINQRSLGQENLGIATSEFFVSIQQWSTDLLNFWDYPHCEWKPNYWIRKELNLD